MIAVALYMNMLPALNAGQIKLLDLPRIRTQLLALERRTVRGSGKDVVDHPSAGMDDLVNCVAGALVLAGRGSKFATFTCVGSKSDGAVIDGRYRPGLPPGTPESVITQVGEAMEEYYALSQEDRDRRDILGPNWRSRIPPNDPSYRPEEMS